MTVSTRTQPLPFLVTTEMPCPYLPGRMERKVVTELVGPRAVETYETLSRAGFRRSHTIAYRPACRGCSACVPVRVRVADFEPGRTLRRIARRNEDLTPSFVPARGTLEQFQLFSHYLENRHGEGEMAGMNFEEYRAMMESSPIPTEIMELRDRAGQLRACCLVDVSKDGLSAVYSFFDTADRARGLGNYVVMRLIGEGARRGLPYTYLGYWIANCRKMSYKTRFRPLEGFTPDGWQTLPPNPMAAPSSRLSTPPIDR
ncbi:MAG: arginyltransferase [Dongiaceae bacterium]